jgi:tRNA(His) guanylyltransferase
MQTDEFGNRMKELERRYTSSVVPVSDILCVRLDGKGFNKFTKSFVKPFDQTMTDAMVETTKKLVKELNPKIGYVQSDEISLIFSATEKQTEHVFGGKVSKINSIMASMCSVYFNDFLHKNENCVGKNLAFFDCRSWAVSSKVEASNVLLWRVQDCRKNSISATFRWNFGKSEMKSKSGKEMIAYMTERGLDWNDISAQWKYGTFVQRENYDKDGVVRSKVVEKPFIFYGDLSLEERVNYIFGDKYEPKETVRSQGCEVC